MDGTTTRTVGGVIDWILENWKFILIIVGLFGTVLKVYSKINKFTAKVDDISKIITTDVPSIKTSVDSHSEKLNEVEENVKKLKDYQDRDSKKNYYLVKGVLASLRGLQEIGVDGPTKEASKDLEQYMMERVIQ